MFTLSLISFETAEEAAAACISTLLCFMLVVDHWHHGQSFDIKELLVNVIIMPLRTANMF